MALFRPADRFSLVGTLRISTDWQADDGKGNEHTNSTSPSLSVRVIFGGNGQTSPVLIKGVNNEKGFTKTRSSYSSICFDAQHTMLIKGTFGIYSKQLLA